MDKNPIKDTPTSVFSAEDVVIYAYTRSQALADGVLVDVSEIATEAGFRWPVAVTAAVWALIEDIPPQYQGIQDVQGRLWDVVWMAAIAARRNTGAELLFQLIMHHEQHTYLTLKMVVGPGDAGEPVITIMLPHED